MSLILEALKKSEQQRKLGEAPTLGSPMIAVRRRRNMLPVLIALIVVAAGAAWWLLRDPAPIHPAAVQVADNAKVADIMPAAPAKSAAPVVHPTARGNHAPVARASSSNPMISIAQKDRLAGQLAEAKSRTATSQAARTSPAPASNVPEPARVPDKATPAKSDTVSRTGVNEDRPVIPTPLPTKPLTPPAPVATAPAPAATAPMARSKPNQPAVPSLFELPYAKRKDIPPIELTMHVYSADPAGRFVVIKGERRVEGDDLGDGLVLKQIRADGIVLDYKGTEFAFPRDGGH